MRGGASGLRKVFSEWGGTMGPQKGPIQFGSSWGGRPIFWGRAGRAIFWGKALIPPKKGKADPTSPGTESCLSWRGARVFFWRVTVGRGIISEVGGVMVGCWRMFWRVVMFGAWNSFLEGGFGETRDFLRGRRFMAGSAVYIFCGGWSCWGVEYFFGG